MKKSCPKYNKDSRGTFTLYKFNTWQKTEGKKESKKSPILFQPERFLSQRGVEDWGGVRNKTKIKEQ